MKNEEEECADHHLSEVSNLDEFLSTKASSTLRVCCYGSSASTTPQNYLDEAYNLGKALAKRGHVCVNGAGAFGCMGALNNGCLDYNGHAVGVIHEMFMVDGSDWIAGSHSAFHSGNREILVTGGDDLQQRKKMLVKDADALIVLPGGPGTWDELMEMACAKNLGLMDLPIVCVNVDGYYDSLLQLFHRGNQDGLVKSMPHEIFRFESTATAAVRFIESEILLKKRQAQIGIRKRKVLLPQSSMIGDAMGYVSNFISTGGQFKTSISSSSANDEDSKCPSGGFKESLFVNPSALAFTTGFALGVGVAMRMVSRKT